MSAEGRAGVTTETTVGAAQLRAAVVGAGFIGVAHIDALRRIGVDVAGIVDSSPERARAKAAARHLPAAYDSLDAVLADASVDVVHITSPNALHAEQVLAVIDAGKHVVCEKPLALTSAEAATMLTRAQDRGLVHAVGFNLRCYPLAAQMAAMVRSGAIGAPRFVTGSYLQDWLLLETDWNWRLVADRAGSLRAVADIGSHWLDLAQLVTGRQVTEVLADLHTFVPTRTHPTRSVETFAGAGANAGSAEEDLTSEHMTSDDAAGILLRFEGGARGVLSVSQVSAGRKNSLQMQVDGAEAGLSWCSEEPERLWIGHRSRPNELLTRDPSLLAPEAAALAGYPGGHVEGYADTFRALFAQVYADVARGGPAQHPAYPTFADGLSALQVTEAVARSAADQRWTVVDRALQSPARSTSQPPPD